MKALVQFCLLVNGLFFIFGVIIISQSYSNVTIVNVNGTNVELKFNLNNIIPSIIAFVIAIAMIGINVFGSGLQDTSVSIITTVLKYLFLWVVISIFSSEMFQIIPAIGDFLYLGFTLMYGVGVLMQEVDKL